MKSQTWILVAVISVLFTTGCRSARKKTAELTLGTVAFLAQGVVNGVLDNDESTFDRQRRETTDRAWIRHWQDNPDENPAMTEAFKNRH